MNLENEEIKETAEQDPKQEQEHEQEDQEVKTFTADQVNEIVSKRLQQQKKANQKEVDRLVAERQAELDTKEKRLSCKEYLLTKRYPTEYLDLIDTSDPEKFQEKVEKTISLNAKQRTAPPLRSDEPSGMMTTIEQGFSKRSHTPKNYSYDGD